MSAIDPAHQSDARDALWRAFVDPPDDARPRAWWHWMDGNVEPAGIRRDLTWLHGIGVRGVQLFDGGMGLPLVVPEAVRPGSSAWADAIDVAVQTADDLGLELAVATSSGWSAAGGPWVAPEDAMKKVVWSETVLDGGRAVEQELSPLPSVAGLYQDSPHEGGSAIPAFAIDWVVLALPHRAESDPILPAEVTASAPVPDATPLVDSSFDDYVTLPRDPDGWSEAWIEQHFDEPITVRSVVVGLPGARGFGAAPTPDACLLVSSDGLEYREVARLEATTVPARSASFSPVTGTHFRLVLSGASAAEALPNTSPGVLLPPVLRRADEFRVSEFALRTDARVHHAEAKAGFGVIADYYRADGAENDGATASQQILDLSAETEDGILRWQAPPGRWTILRFGASLTGQTNGPAPIDSTGLEVDKLDGVRVCAYLETHLTRFGRTDDTPSRFTALLSDSIEAGPQNWTDRIREEFRSRRGYDPLPWLPTLAGRLVDSAGDSDRFLYDYRRTLSELLAQEYYGTLGAQARRRGMTYYAEALEDRRPSLGDDLAMRAAADVPMGAMWTFSPDSVPRSTYVADLKGAASVAHVHGKDWVGSEAFTSFDSPWSWTPRTLKHIADLQLSLGVTRFCIHSSPHQPIVAPPPGIALAPFLGQSFTVNETWATMARPWIDYLARCSALLGAGRPAVDVAVFVGEEGPVTELFGATPDHTVPDGFDFDYVGADALTRVLRVESGTLVSDGASYDLLYLGGSTRRMTLAALSDIERLVDAGATVVGIRPESSPSLADDPAVFVATRDRIWSADRVLEVGLGDALERIGLRPPLEIVGGPVRHISRIVDGMRVTFMSNPGDSALRVRVTAPDDAPMQAWDPVTVSRRHLPRTSAGHSGGRAEFDVTLPPFGSLFIMPGTAAQPVARTPLPLAGDWDVRVPGGSTRTSSPDPTLWTDFGEHERGFSGIAVYHHQFTLEGPQLTDLSLELELGVVRDVARVVINGTDCGIMWTPPFVADVSAAVREGINNLEVHVATPWRNRLIAEAGAPSGEIFAPMTKVFEESATALPAGLAGTCVLRVQN